MNADRRQNRSSHPAVALHLYLAELARRTSASRLVVSDEDGLLVDGIGEREELERLAAYGPDAPAELAVHSTLLPTSTPLRLTSVGGRRPDSAHATAAVDRIMGPN